MRGRFTSGKSHTLVMLLAGLLVSVFAGILTFSTTVLADAAWDANGNVTVDGTTHASVMNKQVIKNMGFADGTLVFASSYNSDSSAGQQTISVVSFAPGSDLQSASSATLSQFTFTPPNDWRRTAYEQTAIDGATYPQTTGGQGCNIDQIGWMICGPSMWIAKGVDTIYGWIEDFLTVRELEVSNTSSSLYQAWDIMRGIANVAFIIAFLIIIYSQVSSLGISNYGIKKLAPRLIIAALFVNLSFYICAIAVDLSNILGYALKDLLDGINSGLINTASADNEGVGSTESLVQAFLTGGTLLVGGGLAVSGSLTAGTPLLIPLLLTVFVALLVALVVFAVRQALIVILVVIAPLAFVCYLLPGTEKWFEKWRSTFFTMLFFFPAFAVVFGGAQLAGMLITSNASTIVMVIIGWAVQLAPLALAPLVMKLGGGVLNRVAGIVNDPSKGIIDKSKQWAQNKSKLMAANSRRRMEAHEKRRDEQVGVDGKKRGRKWYDSITPYGSMRRMARYADTSNRLLKDNLSDAENALENSYHGTKAYEKHHHKAHDTGLDKELVDKSLDASWSRELLNNQSLSEKNIRAKSMTDQSEALSKRVDARYEDFKTGKDHVYTGNMASLQQATMRAQEDAFNTDQRVSMAKADQSQRIAERLQSNIATTKNDAGETISYRDYAGGIAGESGAAAALANAIAARKKAHDEGVSEARVIQEHFKLTGSERQQLTRGESVTINDERGHYTFSGTNSDVVEAAGLRQIEIGTFQQKMTTILGTNPANTADISVDAHGTPIPLTAETHAARAVISDAAARNGIAKTAVFLGGKAIEDMNQGKFTIDQAIIQTLAGGKVKEVDLSSNDAEALELMFQFDPRKVPTDKMSEFTEGMQSLRESAWRILRSADLRANASKNAIKVFEKYAKEPPTP